MDVLIDSSVLVRLRERDSPEYNICWDAVLRLRKHQSIVYLCTQALIEFWSVSTRPREQNGLGQSIVATAQDCRDFIEVFSLLPEPPDITERWLFLVERYAVRGKQVHDARMAAFAWAHSIENLLTLNVSDFSRFQEIHPLLPTAV